VVPWGMKKVHFCHGLGQVYLSPHQENAGLAGKYKYFYALIVGNIFNFQGFFS
jgi:hypothetical protein